MAVQKPAQQSAQPQTSNQSHSLQTNPYQVRWNRPGSGGINRWSFGSPLAFGSQDFSSFNPFSMLRRMHDEMDRLFADNGFGNFFGNAGSQQSIWSPAIEVSEKNGNYVVQAELPGLNEQDVNVEIGEDTLTIQGKRNYEHEETQQGMHLSERRYGEFYRAIPLPEGADTEKTQAHFNNGLLEITIPMAQAQKKKQVQVTTGARKEGFGERAA